MKVISKRKIGIMLILYCTNLFAADAGAPPPIAATAAAHAQQVATQSTPTGESVLAPTNKPSPKTKQITKNTQQTQTQAPPPQSYLELVFNLGPSQVMAGKSFIGISSFEQDWLKQTNSNYNGYMASMGIGYVYFLADPDRYAVKRKWFPSIEPMLNLYYFHNQANGNVLLFDIPQLTTSTFKLPVASTALMFDVVLTIVSQNHFSLYVLGGAGYGVNLLGYSDHPNSMAIFARPALTLGSRYASNFAYDWGVGVSYAFNKCISAGFQYLYSHLGNVRTGSTGVIAGQMIHVNPPKFAIRYQNFAFDLRYALN